jgi:hypothetical protein
MGAIGWTLEIAVTISRQGERLLADLDRALEQLDDEILAPLTHSEREMLNELLARQLCTSALNAPTRATRDVRAEYRGLNGSGRVP